MFNNLIKYKMKKLTFATLFLLLATFTTNNSYAHNKHKGHNFHNGHHKHIEHIFKDLSLTKEQQDKIHQLMDKHKEEMKNCSEQSKELKEKRCSLRKEHWSAIKNILTDKQQKIFEEKMNEAKCNRENYHQNSKCKNYDKNCNKTKHHRRRKHCR